MAIHATRIISKEVVSHLKEGVIVWVEQKFNEMGYLTPMVSDGEGNLGCFALGISVLDVGSPNYRYWSNKPTESQMKDQPWEI